MKGKITKMINKPAVLLTAFRGTSSEKLIADFDGTYIKIILENEKNISEKQLVDTLENNKINYIFSFGQKPVIKDKIYIETVGKLGGTLYNSNFDYNILTAALNMNNFSVRISSNAGTSFCNHIYACGLKYISENQYNAKMVFLHVPFEKNISDIENYSKKLIKSLNDFFITSILNNFQRTFYPVHSGGHYPSRIARALSAWVQAPYRHRLHIFVPRNSYRRGSSCLGSRQNSVLVAEAFHFSGKISQAGSHHFRYRFWKYIIKICLGHSYSICWGDRYSFKTPLPFQKATHR